MRNLHWQVLVSSWRTRFTHSFFSTAPATSPIYTLSLHDALPISVVAVARPRAHRGGRDQQFLRFRRQRQLQRQRRSEEHTSELQSRGHLVCRLLLEKKKRRGTPQLAAQRSRECLRGSEPDNLHSA